ncbi:Putative cytoplasmic protein [Ignavibacterium album JCM 16511]|uniref:Putative cytoplasmic protein n=1 Tax=Ignavibacterium album (strain DSM 19864 / JCM 16511 / NBRC 101810 / Mat9-16) TaxID=945713 RepID=I0AN52_IGNAJ|nr:DUF4301 family protein [Ignavibacterium album]AFH50409.1 Putative cytoplasmic protein [Ignavibacterium album JCM 16511]
MDEFINKQLEILYSSLNESEARIHPPAKVKSQIQTIINGLEPINLIRPCKIGDGIIRIDESKEKHLLDLFERACSAGRFIKFVPASGAATRMFSKLQATINKFSNFDLEILKILSSEDKNVEATYNFLINIERFAFFDDLKLFVSDDIDSIIKTEPRKIIERILLPDGLNYSNKPKAVLKFHKYKTESRTAFAEHLFESYYYQKDFQNKIKMHFTISEEHENLFKDEFLRFINKNYFSDAEFHIDFSFQKKSTDSITLNVNNEIYFDDQMRPLFRPAGHGALLENLNELKADLIFIKNIDNVCVDRLKPVTIKYKKLLAGFLLLIQKQLFEYLNLLNQERIPDNKIDEMIKFCESFLNIPKPDRFNHWDNKKKRNFLFNKFNRPLRVCGVVKNEGQPGGAPFWVKNDENEVSVQIIEGVQVDFSNEEQKLIFNNSTHFNPVDIVCAVKDYKGDNFNLLNYADPKSAIIVHKTMNGNEIKSLELPGLWNGGMSNWISVFVEVPIETFNPVKEINDLLNDGHIEEV